MATGSERRPFGTTLTQTQVDEGLRRYMLRVYNYMGSGLALTGIVAYVVAHTGLFEILFSTGIGYVIIFSPFVLFLFMGVKIRTMKPRTAQTLFWVLSILMGASLSYVFLAYTSTSIVRVFFITAAMFGATSLYGYTTKRSLARWGSFLFMGLIGAIVAIVVNWFMQSPLLQFVISVGVVLLFTGLTAYDTQRIKKDYVASDGQAVMTKKAIYGALKLYWNFIIMFQYMLMLFGGGRE